MVASNNKKNLADVNKGVLVGGGGVEAEELHDAVAHEGDGPHRVLVGEAAVPHVRQVQPLSAH